MIGDHQPPAWRPILRAELCAYCHRPQAGTIDHIRPRRRVSRKHRHGGGTDTIDNLTPACQSCNTIKDDQPLLLFLAKYRYPVQLAPTTLIQMQPHGP
jgi:5-methylcytosine-specific restriction endonuclease McrA